MNILFATSEVEPFSKTGGLADVSGALPPALARGGLKTSVITPAYRCALQSGLPIERTGLELEIPIGSRLVSGRILESRLPHSGVPVYLVEQPGYFDREELYGEKGEDYRDNCERFVFFCRAIMEAIRLLPLEVDILHCSDWQTGLVPAYLDIDYGGVPGFEDAASVFTIHNLAYQGRFWHWDMLLTGLDWKYFNWHQMEFYGELNLTKTGIVFADQITTVSPTYAREIQNGPLGCGLDAVLSHRSDALSGILNGVDYSVWDPAHDPHLQRTYDVETWPQGKAACKAALQKEIGLPQRDDVPLIGFVGRLASQKGLDLVEPVLRERASGDNLQWVFLGSGPPEHVSFLQQLSAIHPDKVAVHAAFSNPLAHRIYAGCDIFLMPSRYEPCGLGQLYSLKYGTVPLVRNTGGLADTITDTTEESLAAGTASGFHFDDYAPPALEEAITRAVAAMYDRAVWRRLVETGMRQDWSWQRSAQRYVELYRQTLSRHRQATRV